MNINPKIIRIISRAVGVISFLFVGLFLSVLGKIISNSKMENLSGSVSQSNQSVNILGPFIVIVIVIVFFIALFILSTQFSSYKGNTINNPNKDNVFCGGNEKSSDLCGIKSTKYRIQNHILSVKGYATANLIIGSSISILGIVFVLNLLNGNFILYFEEYLRRNNADYKIFFILFVFPKLSIAIMIQVFSYFFLSMYRANLREIRYFQVELNDMDLIQESLVVSNLNVSGKDDENNRHISDKIFDIIEYRGKKMRKNISSDEMLETLNSLSKNTDIIGVIKSILDKK